MALSARAPGESMARFLSLSRLPCRWGFISRGLSSVGEREREPARRDACMHGPTEAEGRGGGTMLPKELGPQDAPIAASAERASGGEWGEEGAAKPRTGSGGRAAEEAEEEEVEQTHDMIKAIFNKIKIKKLKMQIIKLH